MRERSEAIGTMGPQPPLPPHIDHAYLGPLATLSCLRLRGALGMRERSEGIGTTVNQPHLPPHIDHAYLGPLAT